MTINQLWRVFASGFCFTLFGIGGLILSFALIPIVKLFTRDTSSVSRTKRSEYRVQRLIQVTFDLFCKIMKLSGAIDYKITGAEQLKEDRSCLIIANHPSLIDYVLIASQLQQCDCLVKAALWHNPFIRKIVMAAGYIPNSDPEQLIQQCSNKFDEGNVMLVFPEGTRTRKDAVPTIQRGAAQIAVRTRTDLRVIHISVVPSFLTKQSKWYQVPITKPFFHIQVKGKIEIEPFIHQSSSTSAAARRLSKHFEEVLFEESK
jgi:1-acyl-sn-glycerol-3-phosphate acyltransferase